VYVVDTGARVLSMSLDSPTLSPLSLDATACARSKDVLVLIGLGNSRRNAPFYPAATPRVVTVGATDEQDRKPRLSTYGAWIPVVAPGQGFMSLLPTFPKNSPGKGYGQKSGTSMATASVAGLTALLSDTQRGWSAAAIKVHLERTVVPVGLG